jgi:hypothetical protein
MTTINQVLFPKVFICGPSGYIADVNSSGQLMTTGSGGGSGTVTNVATSGLATGGPISVSGTISVAGSGNTTTAATAAANLAAAPSGDIITADGSGNVQDSGTALSTLAPKASPTFTGVVTAPAIVSAPNTVAFSATPTFNAAANNNFKMTLTGSVTSSTLSGATAGQTLIFEIIQDGVGGRTFAWPSNMKNTMSITGQAAGANETSIQSFFYDGSNAYAISPGMVYP